MGKDILIAILAILDVLLAWAALHNYSKCQKLESNFATLAQQTRKQEQISARLGQEKKVLEQENDWFKQISLPGRQDEIEILQERVELLKRKGGREIDIVRHFRVPMGIHNITWSDLGTSVGEVSAMIEANRSD